MEILLQDIGLLFRDQQKTPPEIVKIWLQLLQNSLAEAKRLLDRSGSRQSCLDCVMRNPRRLSKEIREWNAFFDHLYHGFQRDLSILVTSPEFVSSKPLYKDALLQDVGASGFVGSGIIDAQAQVENWLKDGDRVHLIGVYGNPGVGKTSLLKMLYNKYKKVSNVEVIWVTVPRDCKTLDLKSLLAQRNKTGFLLVLDDLWSPDNLQELAMLFRDDEHSKVLFSTRRKDLIGEMGAEESIEIHPLSRDEGWMLFRRVAFKNNQVSMDIQERARRFADQCKGVPLAINIVAAMLGQTRVDEWDTCFSLMKKVDPSFPATHSGLDALKEIPSLYIGMLSRGV
jgi:hypothetical protein